MKITGEINKALLNVKVILFPGQHIKKEGEKFGAIKSIQRPGRIESIIEKVKNLYISKFEKNMTAITFAEAGEFEIAKDILDNEKN